MVYLSREYNQISVEGLSITRIQPDVSGRFIYYQNTTRCRFISYHNTTRYQWKVYLLPEYNQMSVEGLSITRIQPDVGLSITRIQPDISERFIYYQNTTRYQWKVYLLPEYDQISMVGLSITRIYTTRYQWKVYLLPEYNRISMVGLSITRIQPDEGLSITRIQPDISGSYIYQENITRYQW
ncbi:hypothetical protein LOTGIDRAFT_165564 [Lottia gigantea]|uniref:Uncharacterized protein n=1 Tax=Lottia gigantea TaxID=225164 RepID=V4BIK7_LOTGI|nr:hypothetical protein LOTGIDRAFT_165564 [Lottia gigantea]ESO88439.1 hypothetical protein LOTGIDRAFT_165564 [Lottia gigantea]